MSCPRTDQHLTWPFPMRCKNMQLNHAILLAKFPYNVDNTTRNRAWMKCKGSASTQRSWNSDEIFLRGLFAWSSAEPLENYLVKAWFIQAHQATECYATTQCFPEHGWHCGWIVAMRCHVLSWRCILNMKRLVTLKHKQRKTSNASHESDMESLSTVPWNSSD